MCKGNITGYYEMNPPTQSDPAIYIKVENPQKVCTTKEYELSLINDYLGMRTSQLSATVTSEIQAVTTTSGIPSKLLIFFQKTIFSHNIELSSYWTR